MGDRDEETGSKEEALDKSGEKRKRKHSAEEKDDQTQETHPYQQYLDEKTKKTNQKDKSASSKGEEDSAASTATASAYPVSLTGSCPTCHSADVTYIIVTPKGEEDAELPPLLEKLIEKGRAVKMNEPDTSQEVPSFQCVKCGYGFNLDWTATSLESIFNVTSEGEDKLPIATKPTTKPLESETKQKPEVVVPVPDDEASSSSSSWYGQAAYGQQAEAATSTYPQFTRQYEEYNIPGNFNVLTGKFQRLSNDQHWTDRGLPTDRDARQLAHFMNVNLVDQEPKRKQFKPTAKQIQRFKKEKEEKKRKKLLQTYADY
ncbi:uncharacterized protein [Oscarella lobularis]|uniref:uncharacterized protein n=1 Tax=Oscarella lobularis TaxID=121494 RepID=UPI003313C312